MITENDFLRFIQETFSKRRLIVVTQKEPYVHQANGKDIKEIKVDRPIGGVHILLDAVLRKTEGTMVALASGDADHLMVDKEGKLKVPPWNPSYTLKRVFLTEKELHNFYYGFSSQTIWPLFHAVFVKPKFHSTWWKEYVNVNKKFCEAVLKEIKSDDDFVWINDYYFCLLPKMLRKQKPNLKIGVFWHIPWPTYEIFRVNPWRKEMMEGLLGSDFIGFHRGYHVENFIRCAQNDLGLIVDSEPRAITYKNHTTRLAALPAGMDFERIKDKVAKIDESDRSFLSKELGIQVDKEKVAISAERIDYTKGFIERLKIIDKLLEKHREFIGNFLFISIAVPSRLNISQYKTYNSQVSQLVENINKKYATKDWQPIHMIRHGVTREQLFAYYRAADVCLVTSLDDGMNLVSKEFVICTKPEKGVLVLSKFTGAAKDLTEAMLINPFDIEGSANALFEALTMEPKKKEETNLKMESTLKENNIYKWAEEFIKNSLS